MRCLILIFTLVFTNTSFSQKENEVSTEDIYSFVDEEASYHGGSSAMFKFLAKNLTYYDVEGKLTIKVLVEKDGRISEVIVTKGIPDCQECSLDAVKVVKMMPHWIPAKIGGKNVRSYFHFPITYKKN